MRRAQADGCYEEENAVLERMRALRAEGMGFERLAAQLNAEGIAPRLGKKWGGCLVDRILSRG